jgi:hypothetical protein
MYRRRRLKREIAFSFDSFLDVVANVCGIIIRLILVVWVGARSYHAINAKQTVEAAPLSGPAASNRVKVAELPPVADPLSEELQRHREELAQQQQRLLEQLRQCQLLEANNTQTAEELAALAASEAIVEKERGKLERVTAERTGATQVAQLSLAELQKRSQQLAAELLELEKLPPLMKTLRYRTPVSRPVHTEELHFECMEGRVGFIDLQAFLIEIRRNLDDKADLLKSRWEVEGTAGPVGAYRLRYTLERERGVQDVGALGLPGTQGGFRYSLTGWVVEPITPARGETATAALAPGGEFRRLVDAIDPDQTVVTMWVYADSFALYRQLRDFLHERNIEVAGRPLPPGFPIASSKRGSASRGQ